MKKGRHRRFEEARALKRSHDVDLEDLFETISEDTQQGEHKPEHDAWADLAEEWEQDNPSEAADVTANEDEVDDAASSSDDDVSDAEEASS